MEASKVILFLVGFIIGGAIGAIIMGCAFAVVMQESIGKGLGW